MFLIFISSSLFISVEHDWIYQIFNILQSYLFIVN